MPLISTPDSGVGQSMMAHGSFQDCVDHDIRKRKQDYERGYQPVLHCLGKGLQKGARFHTDPMRAEGPVITVGLRFAGADRNRIADRGKVREEYGLNLAPDGARLLRQYLGAG